MKIFEMKIADLSLDPANARSHNEKNIDAIKGSLRNFGQQKPIVVDKNNVVVAGNGTLAAAKELGWEKIYVVRTDLDGTKKTAYGIADNRSAELGTWNDDTLGKLLQSIREDGFEIGEIGFDVGDLEDFGISSGTKIDEDKEDDVPVVRESFVKRGEIWTLGDHRLMCGDSTSKEDVDRLMLENKAIIFLSDPPYGVSYAEKNVYLNAISRGNHIQVNIENDHMTVDDTGKLWLSSYKQAIEHSEDKASFYIFSPQVADLMMMMMMMIQEAGWTLKHMLVWVKNNHVLGRCDYHYKHEPIFYGWNKSHEFFGGSSCFSTLEFPKPLKNDLHPTMKPIALLEKLVSNSSKVGGLVLDLFVGSGSTLIACEKTGRRCFGMEIDEHYCSVIIKRWEDLTGKKAVKNA